MCSTNDQNPGERTAHSFPGSMYLLPSDEEERQRLLAQHKLYTRLLSDRLILPPTVSFTDKDEILDIGTGAGAWLCDARSYFPETVQLYGVDIESRLFPSYPSVSPNVHLSVCSGTDLPPYWSSKFALVNQRLLTTAYTRDQWRRNVDEIYRVLAPGGYAQLIESYAAFVSGSKTAVHNLFLDDFFGKKGMLWRPGMFVIDMLKVTGFVDVKSEEMILRLGKWAGEDGIQASEATLGGLRGMRDSVKKMGGFGRFASVEEYDKAMDELGEEWDNVEGSHIALTVIYARKPLG